MPWNVETDNPDCDGYAVVVANDGGPNDGGVVGCHDTEAEAQAQRRALYVNAGEEPPASRPARRSRTFHVAAPAPARRSRQFAGAGNVPRDGNGRWTKGGGGTMSPYDDGEGPSFDKGSGGPSDARKYQEKKPSWQETMGPALQRERERNAGGPTAEEIKANKFTPGEDGIMTARGAQVAPPNSEERKVAGPRFEGMLRGTDSRSGGDDDPPFSLADELPNKGKGMNLGQAHDSLAGKDPALGKRLMYTHRTGNALAPTGWDANGNRVDRVRYD